MFVVSLSLSAEIFKNNRASLRKEFDVMGKTGPMKIAGRMVINMMTFCDDVGQTNDMSAKHAHQLVRNVTITPTPAVKGMKMDSCALPPLAIPPPTLWPPTPSCAC